MLNGQIMLKQIISVMYKMVVYQFYSTNLLIKYTILFNAPEMNDMKMINSSSLLRISFDFHYLNVVQSF